MGEETKTIEITMKRARERYRVFHVYSEYRREEESCLPVFEGYRTNNDAPLKLQRNINSLDLDGSTGRMLRAVEDDGVEEFFVL